MAKKLFQHFLASYLIAVWYELKKVDTHQPSNRKEFEFVEEDRRPDIPIFSDLVSNGPRQKASPTVYTALYQLRCRSLLADGGGFCDKHSMEKEGSKNAKERMRKHREKIKSNPEHYEEIKRNKREPYRKRIEEGKIKTVSTAMSKREKRLLQKWSEKTRKCRVKNRQRKDDEIYPVASSAASLAPSFPGDNEKVNTEKSKESGVKRRRENRNKLKIKVKLLEKKIKSTETKLAKHRQQLHRSKKRVSAEERHVKETGQKMLKGHTVPPIVRLKISGTIVNKYRCLDQIKETALTKALCRKNSPVSVVKGRFATKKKTLVCFLENENSRILPGKEDTVTRKKIKKQKMILNDTMKNLFKKFHSRNSDIKMSYPVFCTLGPYWVIPPDVRTHICICKTHENMALLSIKIRKYISMIMLGWLRLIFRSGCQRKTAVNIKRKENIVHKTTKESIKLKLEDLVTAFNESLTKFLQHCANIEHQFKVLDSVKKSLGENEHLIHIYFSENYCCKYTAEIQSTHFGGSKPQVTLQHVFPQTLLSRTVILLYHIHMRSFKMCNKRSEGTCAISSNSPHFLSDGPATQYRNKTMFQLIGTCLPEVFGVINAISGIFQKQGAPDGIGGCIKRTADRIVAEGRDIPNHQVLFGIVQSEISGIEETMEGIDMKLVRTIPPFKGTMKVHSVQRRNEKAEKREIPEEICLSATSPGVNRPRMEPDSPRLAFHEKFAGVIAT
ncbi:hypothetical protein PR048_007095 [Dryococelus australis]|uniref:Uncharacterized protein n=1 Tax=Dryococelus australis TaxID=614101 RepID=A0ABQ9IDN8_9NEOP|nr:hypothetical protein PR048_007095 [Dryococelus australis]